MSQESLPMYTIADQAPAESLHQEEELRVPPVQQKSRTSNAFKWFFTSAKAAPPEYAPLPGEDDAESGLLSPSSTSAPSPPAFAAPPAPAQSLSSAGDAPASGRAVLAECVYAAVWYVRMLLFYALVGAGIACFTSLLFIVLAGFTGLFVFGPTKRIPQETALAACAAGGALAGSCVGVAAWVVLCVRMACAARRDALVRAKRIPPPPPKRDFFEKVAWVDEDEKYELWRMMVVAPLAGGFGLALGLAVVPSLAAAGAEAGYSAGLAVGAGFWGLGVLLVPGIVGAVIRTLADCRPLEGFFGAYCFCYSP
ncbi:hypothetical protein C2E23DRAFT_882012 [Lenzites betulinus]|nr:hypothetical protein C2E23DRAFT_882012 [Lenzites betulinus]